VGTNIHSRILSLRFKLFLFIGVNLIWYDAACQTDLKSESNLSKSCISADIGLTDFHIKDKYLSPLPFRGTFFTGTISFESKLLNTRHMVELFYSHGKPSPDNQVFNVNQNVGSISYSFLMNAGALNTGVSPINIFLGGGISSFVMNSDLVTNSKQGLGYFIDQGWYWSHSLNLNAEGEYLFSDKNILSIQFQIPVFKVVTRPSNGHWMSTKNQKVLNNFLNAAGGGKGEFLWKNFVLLYKIEYEQILNQRLGLKISYRFNYATSQTPFSMDMYMNNFLIGIEWFL